MSNAVTVYFTKNNQKAEARDVENTTYTCNIKQPIHLCNTFCFTPHTHLDSNGLVIRACEEGKEKAIVFNLSGHGLLDMSAYQAYLEGSLGQEAENGTGTSLGVAC